MILSMFIRSFLSFFLAFSLPAAEPPATLFEKLDPFSLKHQLAFYELYPDSPMGKKALTNIWKILSPHSEGLPHQPQLFGLLSEHLNLLPLTSIVSRKPYDLSTFMEEDALCFIESIGQYLPHRKLKGHGIWSTKALAAIPSEEIDLARGVLLYQFENDPDARIKIRHYEAALDVMALQISAKAPPSASPRELVHQINHFIFQELQFRFPPHSLHAKEIDYYTFLPSVMDGREGVCLGVCILYLSLAQRLHLDLKILTPPGHIFLQLCEPDLTLNIETTARGIHLPSEHYLNINTIDLSERGIKEVLGLALMNKAARFWEKADYESAVECYEKAQLFLSQDPLLSFFLGCNYLFVGRIAEGKRLLQFYVDHPSSREVHPSTLAADYLRGKVSIDALREIFLPVDESRESIIAKQHQLQTVVKRFPSFREGWMHLAVTQLQLGHHLDALKTLEKLARLDPQDPTVHYYLSMLYLQRMDYISASKHLKQAEELTQAKKHFPYALKGLKAELRRQYPAA